MDSAPGLWATRRLLLRYQDDLGVNRRVIFRICGHSSGITVSQIANKRARREG